MNWGRISRRTGGDRLPDRSRLVEAARAAFEAAGAAASMDEIARSAGTYPDALYRHFHDRDELIIAVLDDLVDSLREIDEQVSVTELSRRAFTVAHSLTEQVAATKRRSVRLTISPLAMVAGLLPLPAVATAAAELPVPVTVLTISPLWPVSSLDGALQGSLCQPTACVSLHYLPFWTAGGVEMLGDRLATEAGLRTSLSTETVVFGYSHGAMVAAQWIAEHADDPEAPSPEELSFVLIANPTRAHGGTLPAMPDNQYQVTDIVRQYDPVADFPDNPFNLLAMINVGAGILSPIHLDYTGVDVDDPANIVWTEGNITYVFVPTENLPLLAPLRLIGLGWLADELNEPLKEIVELAYDRAYPTTVPPVETVSAPPVGPAADSPIADREVTSLSHVRAADSDDTVGDRPAAATEVASARSAEAPDTPPAADDFLDDPMPADASHQVLSRSPGGDTTRESAAATDLADGDGTASEKPPPSDDEPNGPGAAQQREADDASEAEAAERTR